MFVGPRLVSLFSFILRGLDYNTVRFGATTNMYDTNTLQAQFGIGQKAAQAIDKAGEKRTRREDVLAIVDALADRVNADREQVIERLLAVDEAGVLGGLPPEDPTAADPDRDRGQKTIDPDALVAMAQERVDREIAKTIDEEQRDDLGRPTVSAADRIDDPQLVDHKNRRKRSGLTPQQKARKLAEFREEREADAIEPLGSSDEPEDDTGEVPAWLPEDDGEDW